VNLLTSLDDHVRKLVRPVLQASFVDVDQTRHFLVTRSAVVLLALVAAPLCLALEGAPAASHAIALAWLSPLLIAVAVVSRTGNLATGEALSALTWIGVASTLAIGSGSALWLGLLLLVPLEASVAARSSCAGAALAAVGVLAAWLPVGWRLGPGTISAPDVFGSAMMMAAIAYGCWLAVLAGRRRILRDRLARAGHDRYRTLSEVIDDMVVRFDRSGAVVSASSAADRLFDLRPRDLVGRGFFEHVHVADRPAFLKLVTDVAATGTPRTVVLRLRTGALRVGDRGVDEPVFARVDLRARLAAADGDPDAGRAATVLALVRDVTAQKLHEEALEEARRAADRSGAGRDLFLANISHELRTPLNAIIGFAEMLASETLAPRDATRQREYAAIIHQSGQHLLAVVNSILDVSKIESGSFAIVPESFDLTDLVTSCCDMVGLTAEQAGVRLDRDLAPGLPEVFGDIRACRQILLNLLSNALKFTPERGRVTVGVRPEGNSILLQVADTGIGIGARDLPRLGDPFFQAQSSYDRAYDGTGLGLSVVRGLVGLHGGRISIESAPGQGTCVTVRLPADCRRTAEPSNGITKIETIPRYPSRLQPTSGPSEVARVHKIA
jgi:cell cycle sensor histidine kinase DivJ